MRVVSLVILVVILALTYSIAVHSQINSEMQELFGDNEESEMIVVLKDDYNVLQQYGISNYKDNFEMKKMMINEQQESVFKDLKLKKKQKGLSEQTDEDYDFELTNTYSTVNGFAGKLKKSSYEKLKNNPKVVSIYKPKKLSVSLKDSAGIINATRVWGLIYNGINITGKGETVCVIDSGVDYAHPALGNCSTTNFTNGICSKVIGGYDFVNSDNDSIDDNGHGTHVAGIVASTDDTFRGIAPDANIISMKMLNSAGDGSSPNLISSIDWCVNNATKFNISVISMSLGTSTLFTSHCDNDDTLLTSSIANAIARNISVIAATGNAGNTTGIASPACIMNVTAVGTTTKADAIDFNRNSITDLLAPGISITSTQNGGGFVSFSGTSMSTPHVAGAFALLHQYKRLEQNIILTPAQIQNALNGTGKQILDSGNGLTFSRINIYSAILSLDTTLPGINFTNPTPANNSNITLNSTGFFVYVNVTSTEVLSSSIIELSNGTKTNSSLTIRGLNSFINLTALKLGVLTFRIYGNDSAGNSNITDLRTLQINNTAPNISAFAPSNEFVSINEPSNQTFSINFSDNENDTTTFFWYLNGSLQLSGVNKSELNFTGNSTSSGFYSINVTISDGAATAYKNWNLTVNNTNIAPNVTSVNLTNTDFQNRTNGTLQAFWSFSDFDGDSITANETLWYVNNTFIANYTNKTFIHSVNTTKLENWTFSVRVFDGQNWSGFSNSSKTAILNSKPSINITTLSITVLETQLVNLSLNASDLDNDPLIFASNKSEFSVSNNALLWFTNLTNSGAYAINITVNDSAEIDSTIVNAIILDARDLDNDGNPDFNETDDDNDGILDDNDFLTGNLSSINTTLSLGLAINGTSNLSKLFNGTFTVNITNGSDQIIEFNFTFNSSNILDFGNLTINRTTNGSSAVSIRGLKSTNTTKTVFLEKINTTVKSVCIKDADAGFDAISSNCDGASETLLTCNNQSSGQYTCFDTGSRYKITGLSNSALKEQCQDADGDGYGTGCSLGTDSCDNNPNQHTSDGCNPPSPSSSGGSSGGGGSGGGGGGGGGGFGYVCNMDWKCGEWNICIDGLQTRQCDFVKVPQHSQDAPCSTLSSPQILTQKCEAKSETSATIPTKPVEAKEIMQLTAESNQTNRSLVPITGGVITRLLSNPKVVLGSVIGVLILALVAFAATKFYRRSKGQ